MVRVKCGSKLGTVRESEIESSCIESNDHFGFVNEDHGVKCRLGVGLKRCVIGLWLAAVVASPWPLCESCLCITWCFLKH